jgi:hypothetical protein
MEKCAQTPEPQSGIKPMILVQTIKNLDCTAIRIYTIFFSAHIIYYLLKICYNIMNMSK